MNKLMSSIRKVKLTRGKVKFAASIASPSYLGLAVASVDLELGISPSGFTLPGNANLAVSFSTTIAASSLQVLVGSKVISTKALAANEVYPVGFFEKDSIIKLKSLVAGTITLHYLDSWMIPYPIATGVFI